MGVLTCYRLAPGIQRAGPISFNPCFYWMGVLTTEIQEKIDAIDVFQSLFLLDGRFDRKTSDMPRYSLTFQSLFLLDGRFDKQKKIMGGMSDLGFQSLFLLDGRFDA